VMWGANNNGTVSVSLCGGISGVLNPEDIAIYRALAGGVTTSNILHGSANSIGGKTLVMKMGGGGNAEDIKFAVGENPKSSGNQAGGAAARYPATRMGVEDVIREAFNDAKAYKASWEA